MIDLRFLLLCTLLCNFWQQVVTQETELIEWCSQNNIELNKIAISTFDGYSRGILALEDIEENEVILRVPADSIMTPFTALRSDLQKQLGRKELVDLPDLILMSLMVKTFVDYSNCRTTIFWTEKELDELQGSFLKQKTIDKEKQVSLQFEQYIKPLCIRKPSAFTPYLCTYGAYKWIQTILFSRTFAVKIQGEGMPGLVPIADMLNTEKQELIQTTHRMTEESLEIIAKRKISKGEQIFAPYGREAIPNSNLLLDYGFAFLENEGDEFVLQLPKIDDKNKEDLLKQAGFIGPLLAVREGGDIPPPLLEYARIKFMDEKDVPKFLQSNTIFFYDKDVEESAVKFLIELTQKTLESYETTLEEDNELLKNKESLPEKTVYAIILRKSEKEIAKKLIENLNARLNLIPSLEPTPLSQEKPKVFKIPKKVEKKSPEL